MLSAASGAHRPVKKHFRLRQAQPSLPPSLSVFQCASLEASHCGKESRYLAVLRKLLENKALEPAQRQAVRQLISESLQGDLENNLNLVPVRYTHTWVPNMTKVI